MNQYDKSEKRTVRHTIHLYSIHLCASIATPYLPLSPCDRYTNYQYTLCLSLRARDRVLRVHVSVIVERLIHYDHLMSVLFDLCCRSYVARALTHRSSALLIGFLWISVIDFGFSLGLCVYVRQVAVYWYRCESARRSRQLCV